MIREKRNNFYVLGIRLSSITVSGKGPPMDLRKKIENVSGADIEAIIDDLAALKKDVAKAIAHVKKLNLDDALDSARDMADDLTDDAADLYKDMQKRGRKTMVAMEKQLDDQPIASLLMAFAAGFVISKLFFRK